MNRFVQKAKIHKTFWRCASQKSENQEPEFVNPHGVPSSYLSWDNPFKAKFAKEKEDPNYYNYPEIPFSEKLKPKHRYNVDPQIGDYPNLPIIHASRRNPWIWDSIQERVNKDDLVQFNLYYSFMKMMKS